MSDGSTFTVSFSFKLPIEAANKDSTALSKVASNLIASAEVYGLPAGTLTANNLDLTVRVVSVPASSSASRRHRRVLTRASGVVDKTQIEVMVKHSDKATLMEVANAFASFTRTNTQLAAATCTNVIGIDAAPSLLAVPTVAAAGGGEGEGGLGAGGIAGVTVGAVAGTVLLGMLGRHLHLRARRGSKYTSHQVVPEGQVAPTKAPPRAVPV